MDALAWCRSLLDGLGEPLLVHHWDADGIASAALLERIMGWRRRLVPRIGFYSAEAVTGQAPLRGAAGLVVVDYGVPQHLPAAAQALGATSIVYIDHHRAECPGGIACCNPVALGLGGEDEYPSTSLLLAWLLGAGREHLDLALVGLVSDLPGFTETRWAQLVEELERMQGFGLAELLKAVEAVDSCYPLLDTACIDHAVELLAAKGLAAVLDDPRLMEARRRFRELVGEALRDAEANAIREGAVIATEVAVDALVTPKVGRILAREHPDSVVIVQHWIPNLGKGMVYVRSRKHMVGWIAARARAMGYEAGGKDRVAVIHYYQQSQGGKIVEAVTRMLKDIL